MKNNKSVVIVYCSSMIEKLRIVFLQFNLLFAIKICSSKEYFIMKKIVMAITVTCVFFGGCLFSGCSTNNVEIEEERLNEYKTTSIQEINSYEQIKLANGLYDETGYESLTSIVKNGIDGIKNAMKQERIDLINSEAKKDMDLVKTTDEVEAVSFYSLQEGYDIDELSNEDLITLAHMVNQIESVSLPTLSPQIEQLIKQKYSILTKTRVEDLNIKYYGNYNGCYAIIIYDITTGVAAVETKIEVGNVVFCYPTTGIEIIICKIR